MTRSLTLALAALIALPSFGSVAAMAQDRFEDRDRAETVGVFLSKREKARSVPVRLPDGRVVLRPPNRGIPFLFGFGDNDGAPSSLPTVGGITPSAIAATPSGGLVPGQETP
ncbi:hypothetical protein [Aurantimonas endophytica]|uniref:Uncharacterized protein n=1 Tax=Aurantimonas endophytica TaxID=1522175 RepID=A0A7W6MNW3_9HYPH|nr:hypothetical protein [Aurantimonas endophytica]MBB4002370.1 hypothetical protein [Aurantimonas endophytica]MCO6402007.1 hypothetical protein [Aurantimonas endophytica]